nr:hypothetical protein CFP56_21005 [Quercus suber]
MSPSEAKRTASFVKLMSVFTVMISARLVLKNGSCEDDGNLPRPRASASWCVRKRFTACHYLLILRIRVNLDPVVMLCGLCQLQRACADRLNGGQSQRHPTSLWYLYNEADFIQQAMNRRAHKSANTARWSTPVGRSTSSQRHSIITDFDLSTLPCRTNPCSSKTFHSPSPIHQPHPEPSNMVSFTSLLLLATTALATPLAVRDAGTTLLVNDLLRLDLAIRNITYAAGNYTGGSAAYQPIRESFAEVNRTNRIAYYDAMTIAPQTIDESNQIIAVVANPITPDITDAVNALIAKKSLIEAAGLAGETAAGLNLISYDHDTLSLFAVAPKLDLLTIPAAAVPVLEIDLTWREGVAAFGGLPLAPITM